MNTHFAPHNQTILVISQDRRFLRRGTAALREEGYKVIKTAKPKEGLKNLIQQPLDFAILDLAKSDLQQFEATRQRHKGQQVPYLLISKREESAEIANRLKAGADDCLVKPISYPELTARVNAILRRRLGKIRQQRTKPCIEISGLRVETTYHAVWVGGQEVSLAPREHQVLTILAEEADSILSPEKLARKIWGSAGINELRALAVYIWRLRRKVEADPKNPGFLRSAIFQRGYYLKTRQVGENALPAKS